MAERLGEALLDLRTNDVGFNTGIEQAKGKAERLGQTLDKTKGSSAQLASEMAATGRSAQVMSASFEQAGQRITQSAGQQRAGMQQLSFQLNDMATMFALGARPMQIFASQSGQVIQSLQMMAGGTSRVAAFLGGPWGIALTSAVVVLAPFISKLFETENALEKVELASDNLADAQSILGRVFDLTTGKLKEQTAQAKEATATLLELQKVSAESGLRKAREGLQAAASRSVSVGEYVADGSRAGMSFRTSQRATSSALAAQSALAGNTDGALAYLRKQRDAGRVPGAVYEQVATQILNLQRETQNIETAKAGLKSIATGNLDPRFRDQGSTGGITRTRSGGPAGGPRGRSQAEIAGDFSSQSQSIERQTLQARLSLASSAQDRADIQRELLALDREQQLAEIASSDLTEDMKASLTRQVEELYGREVQYDEQGNMIANFNRGLEAEILARELARRQAEDAQALSDERFRGEMALLQNALALADTQAAQKEIALKIYDAQVEEERIRLQTIISMAARGEAEAEAARLAEQSLKNLNASAQSGRAAVARQNQTETERYLERVNKTPGQINEAIEGIQIDGLEALNDGLTKAIMGAESLGNVFSRIADQIIADLLRIAIQQAIIQPLANSMFGGGGGGGGGGFGSFFSSIFGGGGGGSLGGGASGLGSLFASFAGGFATGGTIPTGKFAVVGEEGPELAYAGPGGLGIMSNPASRQLLAGAGGGTTVTIPISIDATGADAAAIARVNAKLDQLRQELPATIVTTVREAKDRRFLT